MSKILAAIGLMAGWACAGGLPAAAADRPNVLMIAIDDLNHWVGYTGRNPQSRTPNLDRLSARGLSFAHAYCAAPLCNPSRAALMSGLRPSTSGCYTNGDNWKKFIPEGRGLTATLRAAGYYAAGAGKIYHADTYYAGEWDDYFTQKRGARRGAEEDEETSRRAADIDKEEGFHKPLGHDLKDEDLADWHITSYCIEQLGKSHDKPLFLACGLHKPHLPWVVPKKYYDLFPLDSIVLPPYREDDLGDLPPAGVQMARPEQDHRRILEAGRWKDAIRSYLACIAYTDMNVGRLLDALDRSPRAQNTIVVLWGDHGWHLGEKHHWRKFALWEEATRAPLIWVVPGLTKAGTVCRRPVDFMGLYPTLCDLTGTPRPKHVEGQNLRPLLADPEAAWPTPALCTYGYQNHTVRSEAWRLIRYADGSQELYDEARDPYEWTNLAKGEAAAAHIEALARWLPTEDHPAAERPRAGKRAKNRAR